MCVRYNFSVSHVRDNISLSRTPWLTEIQSRTRIPIGQTRLGTNIQMSNMITHSRFSQTPWVIWIYSSCHLNILTCPNCEWPSTSQYTHLDNICGAQHGRARPRKTHGRCCRLHLLWVSIRVCVCVHAFVCVHVWVFEYVCVCVCVCDKERRVKGWVCMGVFVCVCVCVCLQVCVYGCTVQTLTSCAWKEGTGVRICLYV